MSMDDQVSTAEPRTMIPISSKYRVVGASRSGPSSGGLAPQFVPVGARSVPVVYTSSRPSPGLSLSGFTGSVAAEEWRVLIAIQTYGGLEMNAPTRSTAAVRRFDLDWIRVSAFGFLILYHVGMVYVPWWYH